MDLGNARKARENEVGHGYRHSGNAGATDAAPAVGVVSRERPHRHSLPRLDRDFRVLCSGRECLGRSRPVHRSAFGYSGAGGSSFQWNFSRASLSVLPAIVGIVGALLVLGASGSWRLREGRASMRLGGLLSLLAGAWFALGWAAWGPIHGGSYLASGTALRRFSYVVGIAVGPGVLVVAFGALVFGFLACASRWRGSDEDLALTSDSFVRNGDVSAVDRPVADVVVRVPSESV